MAEEGDYPLLVLPDALLVPPVKRRARGGGASNPEKPVQVRRLEPQFAELQRVLDAHNALISTAPGAASPEHVLVFETNGPPAELFAAIAANPQLEWLAEQEERVDQDEYFRAKSPTSQLTACIYMVLFNQAALSQLLSLWGTYKAGRMPGGHGAWSAVFRCLRSVRRWGPEDRLREAGLLREWMNLGLSGPVVPVEIELWARSAELREAAEVRIRRLVEEAFGAVLDKAFIAEIRYHALLAELPREYLEQLLTSRDVDLIQADEIYLLRATPQASRRIELDAVVEGSAAARETVRGSPVCALLDGLPMENHAQLRGHLIVDDPDNWAARYPVADRRHGTAMASLIVHGDQSEKLPALDRPLYVRPILRAVGNREQAPATRLWVDLIHQAVRRLVATDGGQLPVAPSVRIINLSVGDAGRPFLHEPSPLGRLLDWLAWKYGLLFIVSAGNYDGELPSPSGDDAAVVRFLFGESRQRRLLSPAETINGLTVGALNIGGGAALLRNDQRTIPARPDLPAAYSAQGRGIRRAVKPDILAPGGQQLFKKKLPASDAPWVPLSNQQAGHLVAVPGTSGANAATWLSGTSNAAALTSRAAIVVSVAAEQLIASEEGESLREVPVALVTKGLLVHTAEWRDETFALVRTATTGLVDPNWAKDQLSGLLGYGVLRAARGVICAPERATAVGGGVLGKDQRALHRFPVPAGLHLHATWRRLTATLAWFSPINSSDRRYRVARLSMDVPSEAKSPLLLANAHVRIEATTRGTVQHLVLERERGAINLGSEESLEIGVTCAEDAGGLSGPVPYVLVVSLEVAAEAGVPVYQQVAQRLRVQPRVPVR